MKKVSIIIPVCNVENHLNRAILSALNQTYCNIEIILVDDGSTDNSGILCDDWQKKDDRIRVIHQKNGGLSAARNTGLDIASGDYIYFFDSDDHIKENLLEQVVPYLDSGIELAAFNYYSVRDNEFTRSSLYAQKHIFSSDEERLEFITENLCNYTIGWEVWSRIFVKRIIDKHHIRFADNNKIFAEDLYFSLCYMAHADKIVCMKDCLYYYTLRNDSIMRQDLHKNNCGRFSLLSEAVYEHYRQNNCDFLLKYFPLIHWAIMKPEIQRRCKISGIRKMPEEISAAIQNYDFFQSNLKKAKEMLQMSGALTSAAIMRNKALIDYVLNGNLFRFGLISKGSKVWSKCRLFKNHSKKHRLAESEIKTFLKNPKRIYFLGTEEFGNTGDYLINEAINEFLQKNFPEYKILEVSVNEYERYRPFLLKYMTPEDIIILPGGGNWGDRYPAAENTRLDIIRNWKDLPIIIFPQTICYSCSEEGKRALATAQKIIDQAKNLVICTRENISCKIAEKSFKAPVFLIPDIVFSKDIKRSEERKENKILWCMRNDLESVLPPEDQKILYSACRKLSEDIERIDLQLPFDVFKKERRTEIDRIMKRLFQGDLLITDRLHGMICAAIIGLPCIVFPNFNHKIKSSYEWISQLSYIRFVNDVNEAIELLPDLLKMENCQFDSSSLQPYFEKLKHIISEHI